MLRDLMEQEGYIAMRERTYHDYVGEEYTPGPRAFELELDFNETELRILSMVSDVFGTCTSREVSERSHRERAWIETPDRALISYMLAEYIATPEDDSTGR
jgi:hypothetical protein